MIRKVFSALAIFVLFQSVIAPIQRGCENCGCCVNNTCARATVIGITQDDVCTHGCIEGIGGNKCYNKCPNDCVTCEQTYFRNCSTCKTGKYLNTHDTKNKRCENCPTRCKKCASLTNCQECLAPYYNSELTGSCSSTCPTRCKSCTSSTQCLECNHHYYNDGNVTDCSLSCPRNCKTCSIQNTCHSCINNYYGNECNKECPKNCRESFCHMSTGYCTSCKGNYAGPTCDYCKDGMYGPSCAFNCPSNQCSDNQCDRYTGNCTSCQYGFYGSLCDLSCSSGCRNGSCDSRTGSCFACLATFSGNKCCIQNGHCLTCSSNTVCGTCSDGFYGDGCDKECPALCKYPNKMSGILRCERKNGICSLCEDGFHGDFCNRACSNQCLNNRCNKDNGHCSEGCLNGYTGTTCTEVLNTLGMAVGISSIVTVVIATILMTASCIILRKWFKKVHDTMKLQQEPKLQTSYMNSEFQASETVHSDDNISLCDIQEYEELNERVVHTKTSDYDQI